jgi:hypothetical protein
MVLLPLVQLSISHECPYCSYISVVWFVANPQGFICSLAPQIAANAGHV